MVRLFDPLRVGRPLLKNRNVMPPMATELSTERGEIAEQLIRHYEERAKGLGLLISGAQLHLRGETLTTTAGRLLR